jgi:hypothetical protein
VSVFLVFLAIIADRVVRSMSALVAEHGYGPLPTVVVDSLLWRLSLPFVLFSLAVYSYRRCVLPLLFCFLVFMVGNFTTRIPVPVVHSCDLLAVIIRAVTDIVFFFQLGHCVFRVSHHFGSLFFT